MFRKTFGKTLSTALDGARRPATSNLSSMVPHQSRREIHTGNLPVDQQRDIANGLQNSATFRTLNRHIESMDKPERDRIHQSADKLTARLQQAPHEDLPTRKHIIDVKMNNAARKGKIASINLHPSHNFVDPAQPNTVNVLSARHEHVPKVAHEMQHVADIAKYGPPAPGFLGRMHEIVLEYRAFSTQMKVAEELGIQAHGVPMGSPIKAALSYWGKSPARKKIP
jgi:hypothetical protein